MPAVDAVASAGAAARRGAAAWRRLECHHAYAAVATECGKPTQPPVELATS